ncbi:ISAzo13 family transposase, partial [Acetobacteraceae bacterium]|nr:ISAzo13 family transposase [Acetobacteraceae bacterium]
RQRSCVQRSSSTPSQDRKTKVPAHTQTRRNFATEPKKELIGEYKNAGSDYRAKGCLDTVNVNDLVDKDLGKVAPYGIYDVAANAGWVSVGIDHDTAAFAVNTIRRWYDVVGRDRYQNARQLLITADGGGSNGSRVRLWKLELQKLADQTGLSLQVCHYPPGTSKWNKIEHRMFCHITQTWRGKPLSVASPSSISLLPQQPRPG